MNTPEQKTSWIERIEELISVLEGSTIGELELREGDTEIIIRRQPDLMTVPTVGAQSIAHQGRSVASQAADNAAKEDRSVAIISPLTGVYYSAPSPTSPPFVSEGDVIQVGQVVALVEAMKVFNEIQAEVSGYVTKLVGTNGEVVQKGSALIRVEPA